MKKKEKLQEGMNPYKYDKLARIPSWIIIFLLKYWAAGAAFFFGGIGTAGFIQPGTAAGGERMLIFFTLILGLFMEYIIKPIVRLMWNDTNNTYRYNMVNKKGVLGLFLNLLYALLCALPIFFLGSWLVYLDYYDIFHMPNIFGDSYGWGIDPFFAGLVYLIEDVLFILLKNLIIRLIKKHQYKKQMNAEM